MALMVSGVGTIIQAKKPMNVGAGMICVQGTSFAFLSSVLAAGFIAKSQGGGPEEILAMIMGVCFLGAFIEICLSQVLPQLKKLFSLIVTGQLITIFVLTLSKLGLLSLACGNCLQKNMPEFWAFYLNYFIYCLLLILFFFFIFLINNCLTHSSCVRG